MANLLKQKPGSPRALCEHRYSSARSNLLLVVAFTVINLVLLVTESYSYFLFSAFVPYYILSLGMLLCGKLPEEFYEGMTDFVPYDNSLLYICLAVAFVITLLYLLSYIFSAKHRVGWLYLAAVLFVLDTVMLLFGGLSFDSILDVLFHAWVLYYLISGIVAHHRLKTLPEEDEEAPDPDDEYDADGEDGDEEDGDEDGEKAKSLPMADTPSLRFADREVMHRVLLETRTLHYDICYRRVKHTNELVINGKVYDELEGVIEHDHTLEAFLDGHHFEVGYANAKSFIKVDGELIESKLRLF